VRLSVASGRSFGERPAADWQNNERPKVAPIELAPPLAFRLIGANPAAVQAARLGESARPSNQLRRVLTKRGLPPNRRSKTPTSRVVFSGRSSPNKFQSPISWPAACSASSRPLVSRALRAATKLDAPNTCQLSH
jgi:hypothetical protein